MWNLKNNTNESTHKTETTQRHRKNNWVGRFGRMALKHVKYHV